MSIEAFLWNYRDGEPIGFEYETVVDILSTADTEWLEQYGCLRVGFRNPDDAVDIYLGEAAPSTNHIAGITVARPLRHPDYLQRIFQIMKLGDVMLFYSDETTPVFVRGADASHYPRDVLASLGEPRYVESPVELLHQT